MSPGAYRPRVGLCVPPGPLPRWLGEALCAVEALGTVRLGLRRDDAFDAVDTPRPMAFAGGPRLAPLEPWAADDAAGRARLDRWTATAAEATPDAWVSFGVDAQACDGRADAAPPAGAPRRWAIVDGEGRSLWTPSPLLRPITHGRGLRLECLELEEATACWHVRRTLHVPVRSRYGLGLGKLAASVARLLELAATDLGVQIGPRSDMTDPTAATTAPRARCVRPAGAPLDLRGPAVQGAAGPRLAGTTAARAAGALRDAWQRQRERWQSEYWRIGVLDAPIGALVHPGALPPIRWITDDDPHGYWADPFGMPGDAGGLTCEFFDEQRGLGRLERLDFDGGDRLVRRAVLPVGGGSHISFPSVFELDGRRYGLAETIATRRCVLHEVGADGAWRPLFPVLEGVAAADPALFSAGGRYWLAYTDADLGERDNLCLRHAERLEGPWTPHAANPVKIDVTSARMAGRPFWHEGSLYRPAQDCLRNYGAAVVIHRIDELTPTAFRETAVRRLEPAPGSPCPDGLHSLNGWGGRTVVDGKRHGLNATTLVRKLRQVLAPGGRPRGVPPEPGVARLLVYLPHLRLGGGETSMLRLAEGLAATGLEVDLVVHTLEIAQIPVPAGVHPIALGCDGTLAAIRRLAAVIRERRPRWVMSAFPHTNVAAVAALALAGTGARCVLTEHAPVSRQVAQQGGWRYRLLPPLIRLAYRRADAIVAVSHGVRDDLQALAGLATPPDVIHNPVLPPDLAAELARAPDHPWLNDPALEVVLSVCRLSAEKDLPTLLRAFEVVHRARPATRLLIAGEGPERDGLAALVDRAGLGGVVQLAGRTDQPLRWMHHARVFVLPSTFEGFGNVLIEALACGTPVVSTDCPVGPREILQDGAFGALVPVGDADAMAREIVRAIEARRPPPGAREAALVHTHARACDAYLRLLQRLVPPAAGGAPC